MTSGRRCPCGLGDPYPDCCGRLHAGETEAATAEQLMRARYSAFAVGDAGYLARSWHPATRPDDVGVDPDVRWLRLDVLATDRGGFLDDAGQVEFEPRYGVGVERGVLHERSRFVRHEGRWVYVDGG